MSKELAQYNEKAISLKQYLNNESIKAQIMAAAPKMLNAERFLKVFYGATLRNPKLLECTTESMLQAAMFFAQLGLEPILGRAYLVPYLNSKNVDGRWVKQYEVQAQIGYQGLVDLARRSGTISDVWGACVYENDTFDLSYGMNRDLVHKPWYMDTEKRKAGQPGEFIGAYVVWKLKDETKHPEFMPAHEIYKRRAKSQSYHFSEFGDPQKGGGKKDSVWHLWHDDMAMKTVIKHSAKIVPASIEFMQAVEMDSDEPTSYSHQAPFTPMIEMAATEPASLNEFDEMAKSRLCVSSVATVWPDEKFDSFVALCASKNRKPLEQFKAEVMESGRFPEFWAAFEASLTTAHEPVSKAQVIPTPNHPAERSNWIKLRGAGYADYVMANLEAFKEAPEEIKQEARGKWISIYKGEKPWPLDEKAEAPASSSLISGTIAKPEIWPPEVTPKEPAMENIDTNPEKTELAALRSELAAFAARFGAYLLQAQKELGMAIGLFNLPSSIDGCRVLLEKAQEILQARPPKNRN